MTVTIDINTATAARLDAVPGLEGHGFEIARYRDERGRFTDLRQLDEVPGLAGKTDDLKGLTAGQRPAPLSGEIVRQHMLGDGTGGDPPDALIVGTAKARQHVDERRRAVQLPYDVGVERDAQNQRTALAFGRKLRHRLIDHPRKGVGLLSARDDRRDVVDLL